MRAIGVKNITPQLWYFWLEDGYKAIVGIEQCSVRPNETHLDVRKSLKPTDNIEDAIYGEIIMIEKVEHEKEYTFDEMLQLTGIEIPEEVRP